jgi:hypothetical protein
MTYKSKRIFPVLVLAAALVAAALPPVSAYGEKLRFVFLADSRGNDNTNLINTAVVTAINTQILALSPRPAFAIFGGDQAYSVSVNGAFTFQDFKNAMAALTNAGIPLYTVMGNHELCDSTDHSTYLIANQTAYQAAFNTNPGNGPPGYQYLVYSFESPGHDAFFAVLDQYYLTGNAPVNLTGTFDSTQLSWLQTQIAQTKATHKFLFTHGPYYYIDNMPPPPDTTYTNLWKILDDNRFDIYCCGHNHLFSRKAIDSSILPSPQLTPPITWKNSVVQLLTGTMGAPIDQDIQVDPIKWNVHMDANTYYFSVVDISGTQVTVNSYKGYTGAYTIFDTFTINKSARPAENLLLLN